MRALIVACAALVAAASLGCTALIGAEDPIERAADAAGPASDDATVRPGDGQPPSGLPHAPGHVDAEAGVEIGDAGTPGPDEIDSLPPTQDGSAPPAVDATASLPPAGASITMVHAAALPAVQFCFAATSPGKVEGGIEPGGLLDGGLAPGLAFTWTPDWSTGPRAITAYVIPASLIPGGVTDCATLIGSDGSGGLVPAGQFYGIGMLSLDLGDGDLLMALTGCAPGNVDVDAAPGLCGVGYDPAGGTLGMGVTRFWSVDLPPAGLDAGIFAAETVVTGAVGESCTTATSCSLAPMSFGFASGSPDAGLVPFASAQIQTPALTARGREQIVPPEPIVLPPQGPISTYLQVASLDGGVATTWSWSLDDVARASGLSDNFSGAAAYLFVLLGDPGAAGGGRWRPDTPCILSRFPSGRARRSSVNPRPARLWGMNAGAT